MRQPPSSLNRLLLILLGAGILCLGLGGMLALCGCSQQGDSQGALNAPPESAAPQMAADAQEFLKKKLQKKLAKGPKRFDQPAQAQKFFVLKRAPLGETTLPMEKYLKAREQMQGMPGFSIRENRAFPAGAGRSPVSGESATLGTWSYVGPGNVGGRTRSLVIHPTTPTTMYAAGVAGGVWKTVDGGASWQPIGDLMANLAVCSLVMHPTNPAVLFAGTGEGFFNSDAVRGLGIFQTTNGGATWTQLANTNNSDFYYVNDLKISPNDPNRMYAATGTGFFLSTNGGGTWTKTLDASSVNGCMSIAVRSDQNPEHVIISCGNFAQAAIHRSINGGASFNQVYTESNLGRTSLAIAPSNQNILYALASSLQSGNYSDALLAVLRSPDGGQTWTPVLRNTSPDTLSTLLLTNPYFAVYYDQWYNQGWYDNVIAVDPLNENIVWAGGIDLFRSDDGGASWKLGSYWWTSTSDSHYAHADQHVIRFHPGYNGTTNKTMYVGNDGGLFRTDDARAATSTNVETPSGSMAWANLNHGYGVTQFYYGAVYPGGGTFFGGTQDNGTPGGTLASGPNNWSMLIGGDGGAVAVNPSDTNILYGENTNLSIQKSTNGGSSFLNAVSGITESSNNFLFIAPFIMDTNNANNLWTGGRYLWRTTNAAGGWTRASTIRPGSGNVSALAVAPGDANRVAAGLSDGYILTTTTALTNGSTTSWPSAHPVNGWISSLAYDPHNSNIIYATCSTFGQKHVWKSLDGGGTWASIDGSGAGALPDVPAFSIVVDPRNASQLYVGTDLGVFVTTDGGGTWAVERTGFPNVITEHLVREPRSNRLYAFTHGRGAWYVPLPGRKISLPWELLLLSH
ncbi:MAG: WD40/YVTN/BNR-like repeat-containing protein [Desulfobaccales bacterium]